MSDGLRVDRLPGVGPRYGVGTHGAVDEGVEPLGLRRPDQADLAE